MYSFSRLLILASVIILPVHAQWQSAYYRDHVLVGKTYDVAAEEFIDSDSLTEMIAAQDIILLGETHSNPDHHQLQANIIQTLIDAGHALTLVLEMLNAGDDVETQQKSSEQLVQQLEKVSPGWDWPVYQPVINVARLAQLGLYGGNIDKLQQHLIMRDPQRCQFDIQAHSVNLCQALPASGQEYIKQTIYHSHCGYMPIEHTQGMAHVQMAKDTSMAIGVAASSIQTKAVLLAGSTHIRKDIGVPAQLEKLAKASLSIAILPVHPERLEATDYWPRDSELAPYDIVIFTPSDTDQDPCIEFSKQLEKMRARK